MDMAYFPDGNHIGEVGGGVGGGGRGGGEVGRGGRGAENAECGDPSPTDPLLTLTGALVN